MAKRKKKNAFTLVSLFVVMVILLGVYFWYGNREKSSDTEDDDTEQKENITVATIDTEQAQSIHYVGKDADITFILQDGTWISENDPNRPIHQDRVKNMLNLVKEINARRIVSENAENLAEYGLNQPKAYLKVTLNDDTTLTLKVGDESSGISGYYGIVNDDGKVYLLNATYGTGLDYSDIEFTAVEEGPDIVAANIDYIQVLKRDGDDFEIINDKNHKYNISSDLYPWIITKPYEEMYPADTGKVSDLQSSFSNFDYQACVDYSGENLDQYGLDDPIASIYIKYFETKTETLEEPETDPKTGEEIKEKTTYVDKEYKIYVGNQDEDGDYYVRKEGSHNVYTMRKSVIDKMLEVEPFELFRSFILIPNIDNVNKVDIVIDGTTYTMEMKRNPVTNEDGEEETQVTYYYNGNEVEEEVFKDVYQKLISAKYDAKIKEDINTEGIKPYLTITYHLIDESKSPQTVSFLPYNDSFYLIDIGHPIRFFADKRQIESIAKAVMEFGRED